MDMTIKGIDNLCELIKNILKNCDGISDYQIRDVCDVLRGNKCAVDKDDQRVFEPPMSCEEAAKLLGVTKQTIHFHARRGRIRRVKIKGSARGRGFVAADVRAFLRGEAQAFEED